MAERFSSESLPGKLAEYLAELVIQLRLSVTLPDFSSSQPTGLPRLLVLARILKRMETQSPDLMNLGESMICLVDHLEENPSNEGLALGPSLLRLVEFLELFLEGLDRGDGLESWLESPYWMTLRQSFANAESSLAVFDALDDVIRKYQQQKNDLSGSHASAEAMAHRWSEVCREGDIVFNRNHPDALDGFCVILLLNGEISRHFLRERLVGGGAEVIVADSPASALEICWDHDLSPTILCDQVGPENHLSELRHLIDESASPVVIPLVLVTMGSGGRLQSNLSKARNLGACGVWCDPYDLAELLPCILQGKSKN